MPQLTCKNLTLGYEGDILVRDLSFEVNKGDYLCIVGENGSGKTTLMKTILRLQAPISGTIAAGDGITAREIGYLPQQTDVQRDFPASVREIVLSGCQARGKFHPFYTKEEKQLAGDNISRMGLTELTDRCYRELSGGQQQRVLLARALCAAQKILLLDEPVSGLDPIVTNDMYALIEHLNKKDGVTIIMVSHDVQAAVRYATHILHVGQTVFFGTTEEYLATKEGRMFAADAAAPAVVPAVPDDDTSGPGVPDGTAAAFAASAECPGNAAGSNAPDDTAASAASAECPGNAAGSNAPGGTSETEVSK